MSVADRLLAELAPMIPGQWHRSEKLQFEIAFHAKVTKVLDEAAHEAAAKRERDIMDGLMQYTGWVEEIDVAFAMADSNPRRNLVLHIGRRLQQFISRADTERRIAQQNLAYGVRLDADYKPHLVRHPPDDH